MNEKDIKIGNSLLLYGEVVKVTEIGFKNDDYYLRVEGNKNGYYLDQFEPIRLTEEILLKCGFEKEDLKPSNKHSNYFSIWINDYKYSFSFAYFREDWGFYHSYTDALREEDNNKFDAISFGIKYLHQLQNLYYCLVGYDLNVDK